MCEYDPSQDVSRAPPAPQSKAGAASAPPTSAPGVAPLIKQHPPAAGQCAGEEAAFAAAAGALVRSLGGLVAAAPTAVGALPAILGFIGSAIATGATAAQLANCKDDAAAESRAK